jgi:hypothetical protein
VAGRIAVDPPLAEGGHMVTVKEAAARILANKRIAVTGVSRKPHVIDGGCPLRVEPTADFGRKHMRFVFTHKGKVPAAVRADV